MDVSLIASLVEKAEAIALNEFNDSSDAVTESILAVLAYEETLRIKHGHPQTAAYTWRMLRAHGVIDAVERVVTRTAVTQGYRALEELGLESFSFESVVARNPTAFSREAVKRSQSRLDVFEADLSGAPSYWWVNHKQTHADELKEGYIWSPKTNRTGTKNQTYVNLTLVQPGDIVILYAAGWIKAFGTATATFQEARIPENRWEAVDSWKPDGWMVPIDWQQLEDPIKPKDFIDIIAPRLPVKNSPLQKNGNGNQGCYLGSITIELGELILELAGRKAIAKIQPDLLEDQDEDAAELGELEQADIPRAMKELITKARSGQGIFRTRLEQIEERCRLTGVDESSFLIASHIKPWRACDNRERLDGSNGLLLAPHVDKLFDRGWISFTNDGTILVAYGAEKVLAAWGIDTQANVGTFSAAQAGYLEYHRQHIFIGHPADYFFTE
jgi:putative restriction endonuclease